MTGRPEFFVDESDINKEYFPSFTIIISTLINQKIPFFFTKANSNNHYRHRYVGKKHLLIVVLEHRSLIAHPTSPPLLPKIISGVIVSPFTS